jgi:hypothetical protein
LGSHTRKPGGTGGRSRRGGGGGGGGGGSGGGGDEERKKTASEEFERQVTRVINRASKKIQEALVADNFSYAAAIATSAAVAKSPVKETMNLLLASAKAFKEAKEKRWEPEPSEIAGRAISYAQQKTGYSLSLQKLNLVNKIITDTLTVTAEKQRRKSS